MGVTCPLATDNAQVYASYGINGLPEAPTVTPWGYTVSWWVSWDGPAISRL
jgi:hypothetical protein